MMNKYLYVIGCLVLGFSLHAQHNLSLWYAQPAKQWTEALPVGNGRLGAMVFGGIDEELLQLNESSLWSGGPAKRMQNPESASWLPKVRAAVSKGDYQLASQLCRKMQGLFSESYLPLGDVVIRQDFKNGKPTAYKRTLDISRAVATTTFTTDGIQYTREVFASGPDQVIVIRFTASKRGSLSFSASAKSLLRFENNAAASNELVMRGKAPAAIDPTYYNVGRDPVRYDDTAGCNGMRFELRIKAINRDGQVSADSTGIHVQDASEVLLLLSAATSYNGFDKCPDKDGKDEDALARQWLSKASAKPFRTLINSHIADYRRYYDRLSIHLDDTLASNPAVVLPSDKRLKNYSGGAYDPGLESLYFQYGRYLLLSCSRPGGLPANLQGIWNKELRAPWSSNYTININTQMNYWPAEVTNLSETHEPLMSFLMKLAATGRHTAREFYNLRGWVAHHNSDVWAMSNPVGDLGHGDPRWANWPMGANWLCRHLWDHYLFTRDIDFLRDTAFPLMKGAVLFSLDWLVEDDNGYLVTSPSGSPENSFIDENGKEGDIAQGSTMDISIIRDLFTNFISASEKLGADPNFRDTVIRKMKRLYPFQIGKNGNLLEWQKDWKDVEVHHRHVSHLYGLYPGEQISPLTTPALAAAAKRTLEIRGDEGTGWSKAWKINFWARLLDGNHAYLLFRDLLHLCEENNTVYVGGGGTYPNFFDAHPPFQIDGNFGGITGIAEMLLQSESGVIHLLPALPDVWTAGKIKGLMARGAFEIGMEWRAHQLVSAVIVSRSGGPCTIRTSVPVKIKNVSPKVDHESGYYMTTFQTVAGKSYIVSAY